MVGNKHTWKETAYMEGGCIHGWKLHVQERRYTESQVIYSKEYLLVKSAKTDNPSIKYSYIVRDMSYYLQKTG